MMNETVFIPIIWDLEFPYEKSTEPMIIGAASSKINALSIISMYLFNLLQNIAERHRRNPNLRKDILFLSEITESKINEIIFKSEDPSIFYQEFLGHLVSVAPEKDRKEMDKYLPELFDIDRIEIREIRLDEYSPENFINGFNYN
jgi:hypothetical protein